MEHHKLSQLTFYNIFLLTNALNIDILSTNTAYKPLSRLTKEVIAGISFSFLFEKQLGACLTYLPIKCGNNPRSMYKIPIKCYSAEISKHTPQYQYLFCLHIPLDL